MSLEEVVKRTDRSTLCGLLIRVASDIDWEDDKELVPYILNYLKEMKRRKKTQVNRAIQLYPLTEENWEMIANNISDLGRTVCNCIYQVYGEY